MARILVLNVQVPFVHGGQDVLVNSLVRELKNRDHDVDIISLPYSAEPKEALLEQIALWRSLNLERFGGKDVDLVIATKFPSYFSKHPCKSLWLVHQHRAIYDLYASAYSDFSDDPRDEELRQMLVSADETAINECRYISGISKNVVKRLADFNGIDNATTLYPPLALGNQYYSSEAKPYILSVARLCRIKRVDLMLKALPMVHQHVKFKIVGKPDEPGIMEYLQNEVNKHHLQDRVEFLGRVSDEDLLKLYAEASAVFYGPHNEDYGYVTLEAMASSKPVVSCTDSGGVLEFLRSEENSLIAEPTTATLSAAVNRLIEYPEFAKQLGKRGRKDIEELGLLETGWDELIEKLLSPLNSRVKAASIGF